MVSAGSGGFVLGPLGSAGRELFVPPLGMLRESLRSTTNGCCTITAELGADVVSGVKGDRFGTSNTEVGMGGLGISLGSLLSAARIISRFDDTD